MLLSVENLRVAYGPIEALHGISFQVEEGEIVTLIGANGAGKSTTLMSLMRLPPPEAPILLSGRMIFQGQDLTRFPPHEVVNRLGISLVPEGTEDLRQPDGLGKFEACGLCPKGQARDSKKFPPDL